jgi:hypothetical protein
MGRSVCALQQGQDFTEFGHVMPAWHAAGMNSCANTTEFDNLSLETGYQG